jgi:hypothetical protein
MTHTLAMVAAACGVAKSTILRTIKSGKISANRDPHGPVELPRTYQSRTEAHTPECNGAHPDASALLQGQLDGLRQVADLLRTQLEDVREDRDRWRNQAEDVREDRDRWRNQAEAIARQLADQLERKAWWRRVLRKP